jgi:MraZ protein
LITPGFHSEFDCKLDDKGRLALPARVKNAILQAQQQMLLPAEKVEEQQSQLENIAEDEAINSLWLCRGFEPCLTFYLKSDFDLILQQIMKLNAFSPRERSFQRTFLRGVAELEPDKAGRMLLPKRHLDYAQLEREAILVGVGNRFELWNPDVYEQYVLTDIEDFAAMADEFLDMTDRPAAGNMTINIGNSDFPQISTSAAKSS